jgi:serine/threonine-protein kinase
VGEVLDWFGGLAAGLDYAAANGIVHHDLKPNNILFDIHNHPFIGDLGIFQVIESLSAANSPRVNPYYESPEQVRRRKLTGLAQQYSLAAIMFHALAGEVLFSGATELVASFKHTSERPRSINKLRSELNEAFSEVLKRALSKEPEKRYATSVAFIAELIKARGGAITPEEVRQDPARTAGPARPPSAPLPAAKSPAVSQPELTGPVRMLLLLALGISTAACLCVMVGVIFSLFDAP